MLLIVTSCKKEQLVPSVITNSITVTEFNGKWQMVGYESQGQSFVYDNTINIILNNNSMVVDGLLADFNWVNYYQGVYESNITMSFLLSEDSEELRIDRTTLEGNYLHSSLWVKL